MTRLGVSTMTSVATVFADRISGLFGLVLLILLTLPLLLTLADGNLALGIGHWRGRRGDRVSASDDPMGRSHPVRLARGDQSAAAGPQGSRT